MSLEAELGAKRQRIAALMDQHRLAGLLLGRNSSVSWALAGGEAHVALNSESAVAAILYTPQRDYLLANQIEMPRLLAEELYGLPFEPVEFPWYEPDRRAALITELVEGGAVGSDIPEPGTRPFEGAIRTLRYQLTPEEQIRLRDLGARTGAAIDTAAGEIAPGMSEFAIAGLLSEECFLRDITPVVVLVATDERVQRFRHPIPTGKTLERYAMLVLCARRHGLIASVTRLVHFGSIPNELRRRAAACAGVDATAIAATRPGAVAGEIFALLQAAYAAAGFAQEWRYHHQGGAAGYEGREWFATPSSREVVHNNQAFAWNPSIAGVKSEDTLLVYDQGVEVVTATTRWPKQTVQVGEMAIDRPVILEVD